MLNGTGIVFKQSLENLSSEFSRGPGDVIGSPKFLTQYPVSKLRTIDQPASR
jgi:hypothetical protein